MSRGRKKAWVQIKTSAPKSDKLRYLIGILPKSLLNASLISTLEEVSDPAEVCGEDLNGPVEDCGGDLKGTAEVSGELNNSSGDSSGDINGSETFGDGDKELIELFGDGINGPAGKSGDVIVSSSTAKNWRSISPSCDEWNSLIETWLGWTVCGVFAVFTENLSKLSLKVSSSK